MSNLIGQRFGQYELLSLLGRGGMATVYRARQESVRRDVAVKVIKPDLAETAEFAARFQREAQTIASLSHPHILKVFDYGQEGAHVYLVTELLTGGSLSDRLRSGPLSVEYVRRLLDQIADALDFAHRRSIVHRDLKPQNVLLDENGNAFLTDFGIAKLLNDTMGLTQTGMAMGTPSYMAPEQWRGQPVDARADIYALGIMLYEMLTGRLPFTADTPYGLMHMHVNEPPPPIDSVRPDLPPAASAVLGRALAKEREMRYPSAGQLAADFRAALDGRPISMPLATGPDATAMLTSPVAAVPTPRSTPRAVSGGQTQVGQAPPNRLPLLMAGLAIIVVLVIGAVIVGNSGILGGGATNTPTQGVAVGQVDTATSTATDTVVVTVTEAAPTTANPPTATVESAAPLVASATIATTVAPTVATTVATTSAPTVAATSAATVAPSETDVVVVLPSPTKTETATASTTPSLTATASLTSTPTATESPEPSPTPTGTPTPTPSPTPSLTSTPTPNLAATGAAGTLQAMRQARTAEAVLTSTAAAHETTSAGMQATATAQAQAQRGTDAAATMESMRAKRTAQAGTVIAQQTSVAIMVGTQAALLSTGTAVAELAQAVPTGLIVFHTELNDRWEINAINPDGTGLRRITDGKGVYYVPAISPDGRFVAVTSRLSGKPDLWAFPIEGNPVRRLTRSLGENWAPAFSPDGQTLVFHSNRDGNYEIFTVTTDGQTTRQLTRTGRNVTNADGAWSPDGTEIVFASNLDGYEKLYIMDHDGDNKRQLTPDEIGAADPAWAPDGQHIIFQSYQNDQWDLYLIQIDGSGLRQLTFNKANDQRGAWSPDSRFVAFETDRDGKPEIYLIDITTGTERRLTNSEGNNGWPSWTTAN